MNYMQMFYKTYGLETIGLRYFNVFGPKQNPNGACAAVIPKFIGQFLNNQNLTINGEGKYSRDFTFVESVVQANIKAALADISKAENLIEYQPHFPFEKGIEIAVKWYIDNK